MNILTKICVVILLVLVIFACPIFITQATVGPNYRHLHEQEQKRSQLFAQSAQAARLRAELLNSQREEAFRQISALRQELATARDSADTKVKELQGAKASLEAEKAGMETNVAKLATVVKDDQEQIKKLTKDLGDSREMISKLTKDSLDLKGLLDEATHQAERAQLVARSFREKNEELKNEIKDLRERFAAGGQRPSEAPEVRGTGPVITGTITAIDRDVASISIGSAQGIKLGMKLMIYRSQDFVAYMTIENVDVGEAAGIITDKRLEPKQGDAVSTLQE